MNRKNKLLALLGVLAALCVMTALADRLSAPVDSAADDAAEGETADESAVAAEIAADDVTGFTFRRGESTLTLTRTDGEWLAPQDLDFSVDADKVAQTLDALKTVTATQKLETPEALDTYGLGEPDATLTVSLADGTETTFSFGDTNSLTGDVYALVNGGVYTLDAAFEDAFTTDLYDYVKFEALPAVESAAALAVRQGTEYAFSLYRTEEAADLTWQKDAVWRFEKSGETRCTLSLSTSARTANSGRSACSSAWTRPAGHTRCSTDRNRCTPFRPMPPMRCATRPTTACARTRFCRWIWTR